MYQIEETDSDSKCFVKAKKNGEPTFTLRAQDELAPMVILAWITAARASEVSDEKIQDAIADFGLFIDWQRRNPNKTKLPD